MITKFELQEDDIKTIIAEKAGVKKENVTLNVHIQKADRPYESNSAAVSALVTLPNTTFGDVFMSSTYNIDKN
jgi:hypothetical protein